MQNSQEEYKKIFSKYPQVKLAYLFGSRANGTAGPLSDYDFAVYLDEKNSQKRFDIRLELMAKLSLLLKTDAVDVVVINDTENPDLKYNIVKEGNLLIEKEPYKLLVEPQIINEYFDFNFGLFKNNLTKTLYV
ncbi:MAG: nucleotidyltransferase domain-containing protein [Candidatus Pacebacteria bacterium]|nr:nucleotidyltransferase domain-containing protein [Candidatus Paceibacterota bacterium]